jgi:ABC-type arginine transport system ATPase subunit
MKSKISIILNIFPDCYQLLHPEVWQNFMEISKELSTSSFMKSYIPHDIFFTRKGVTSYIFLESKFYDQ